MKRLIVGTSNKGKIAEFQKLLAPLVQEILLPENLFNQSPVIIEDGETFQDNALIKAMAYHKLTGLPAIADDSGLMVDYLNGAPGVHSARYAGFEGDYAANNAKLIQEMADVPVGKRGAQFVSVIALVISPEEIYFAEGICRGEILQEQRGNFGFGYDPLFYVPDLGQTFAEMSSEDKNRISHRALAMNKLKKIIETLV